MKKVFKVVFNIIGEFSAFIVTLAIIDEVTKKVTPFLNKLMKKAEEEVNEAENEETDEEVNQFETCKNCSAHATCKSLNKCMHVENINPEEIDACEKEVMDKDFYAYAGEKDKLSEEELQEAEEEIDDTDEDATESLEVTEIKEAK